MGRIKVFSGLDNLRGVHSLLEGRRVGLMTHPSGYDRNLVSGINILHDNYNLTALFACEHGIRGNYQGIASYDDEVDAETGVKVYSLFGKGNKPTPEMLDEIDILVIDLQDVGVRFYTYMYSMTYAIEACCEAGKPVIVLDRLNPIGGAVCQGIRLPEDMHSFVCDYTLPTRHGLTMGELARWFVAYRQLDVQLMVCPLTGWSRELYLDDTDVIWTPASPNMPTLQTALCYPGTCIFEGTNLSEGRGTTIPFEVIGAPFIEGGKLEAAMRRQGLPGVGFRRTSFTPTFSKYNGEPCEGVQMYVIDRAAADPVAAGLILLETVMDLYPGKVTFRERSFDLLLGDSAFREGKEDARTLLARHAPLVAAFREEVRPCLLY